VCAVLEQLTLQPHVGVAVDLHKPGAKPATAEITGLWRAQERLL
jgi:hypothetical protein